MGRSCFLSYASKDEAFAQRLHADLVAKDFECWFAPEDLGSGDKFQEAIEESIGRSDKVIVVLSKDSLQSRWVAREVNAAREREDKENRSIVVPIRLDDKIKDAREPWAADLRRQYQIGDFAGWPDADTYGRAITRLVRDLRSDGPKPPAIAKSVVAVPMERNRRQILARVRQAWIDGVLSQSLEYLAHIDLAMEERPDLLDNPLMSLVQEGQKAVRPLAPRTNIQSLWDEYADAGGMLVVGAPGAGKTTLLLEIAQELLTRAEQDESQLIPVVFKLSQWAVRRAPLSEWFVDELSELYALPREIGQKWVAQHEILPLLDGLDEVAAEYQKACVEQINEFHRQHFVPLVVCGRLQEYQSLGVRLRLPTAVSVQPLSREQIEEYVAGEGQGLATLRHLIKRDPTMWELFDNPLMLSVSVLAYRDDEAGTEMLEGGTVESRRLRLWAKYVDRMFERRGKDARYERQDSLRWLEWLASSMNRLGQSVFQLESLEPSWLRTRRQKAWLRLSLIGIGVLLSGLVAWLNLARRVGGEGIIQVPGSQWVALLGLSFSFGFLASWWTWKPVDRLRWAWPSAAQLVAAMALNGGGLGVVGLAGGWVTGVLRVGPFVEGGGLVGKLDVRFASMIGFGLLAVVAGALKGLLEEGIVTAEIAGRAVPNEGTWRSGANARTVLLIALAVGSGVGLLAAPIGLRLFNLEGAFGTGLAYGLAWGLFVALQKGGGFFVQHWCMRLLIWRYRYAPLDYVQFLDYATERIFLRKVGGGYIFVHRMLRDYFSDARRQ